VSATTASEGVCVALRGEEDAAAEDVEQRVVRVQELSDGMRHRQAENHVWKVHLGDRATVGARALVRCMR